MRIDRDAAIKRKIQRESWFLVYCATKWAAVVLLAYLFGEFIKGLACGQ